MPCMEMRTLNDAKIYKKHVLIIVDYNVQIINESIVSTYKINQTLETIKKVFESGALSITISTHLGRSKNKSENCTKPIHKYLGEILNKKIDYIKISDIISNKVKFCDKSVSEFYIPEFNKSEFNKINTPKSNTLKLNTLKFYTSEFNNKPEFDNNLHITSIFNDNELHTNSILHNTNQILSTHSIIFTDNLRYYTDDELKKYYDMYDIIIYDAFGCAHRKTLFSAYAGLLMEKEVKILNAAKSSDLVIIGGAKIADKLKIMEKYKCNIFVGGCLGITILASLGYEVGSKSLYEKYDNSGILKRLVYGATLDDIKKYSIDKINVYNRSNDKTTNKSTKCNDSFNIIDIKCNDKTTNKSTNCNNEINDKCTNCNNVTNNKSTICNNEIISRNNSKCFVCGYINTINCGINSESIILPVDFLVINNNNYITKDFDKLNNDDIIVDIGDKTVELIKKLINISSKIIWNGPLGKIEDSRAVGSTKIVNILKKSTSRVICGGGETLALIEKNADFKDFYHVSTGGGSMLQMLSDEVMPGIECVKK